MIQTDGLLQGLFGGIGAQPEGRNNAPGQNSMFSSLLGGETGPGPLDSMQTPGLAAFTGFQAGGFQAGEQRLTPEAVNALQQFLQQLVDAGLMAGDEASLKEIQTALGHPDSTSLSNEDLSGKLLNLFKGIMQSVESSAAAGPVPVEARGDGLAAEGSDLAIEGSDLAIEGSDLAIEGSDSELHELLQQLADLKLGVGAEGELADEPLLHQMQQFLESNPDALDLTLQQREQLASMLVPLERDQNGTATLSLRAEVPIERSQLLQSLLALAGSPDGMQRMNSGPDDTAMLARFTSIIQQTVPGAAANDGNSALLAKLAEMIRVNTAASGQPVAGSAEARVAPDPSSSLNPMLDLPRALPSSSASTTPALSTANHQAATQQTFERVVWMVQQGARTARLQLDPPELGRVNIRLEMDGAETRIQLSSSQQGVRDALESMLPRLRDALDQQGLNLADASVSDQDTADHLESDSQPSQGHGGIDASSEEVAGDTLVVQERIVDDGLLSAYA